MIRVGLIGYGYWGPNLARNLHATKGLTLAGICDADPVRLQAARGAHPGVATTPDASEMMAAPVIDAIAIATPVASHFELSLDALLARKHVLVEKPITATSAQAAWLTAEAAERNLVLMVDHPYVYAPAVQHLRSLIDEGSLGRLHYYDSVRANLGRFRADVDVLWDLAVHDLSILDFLMGVPAQEVCAVGASCLSQVDLDPHSGASSGTSDVAYLTVRYAYGLLAHVHANWLAPVKIRRAMLGGSRSMAVFDDIEASEKLKLYDHGADWTAPANANPHALEQRRIGYRTGEVRSPHLPVLEPLAGVCAEFGAAIEQGRAALTDGACAGRVIKVLEAASRSLQGRGVPVRL